MAAPTTAREIEAMAAIYQQHLAAFDPVLRHSYFMPLMSLLARRVYLQRPHTDDMMQMLCDLGIEAPEFQPISFDGLTFRWRR